MGYESDDVLQMMEPVIGAKDSLWDIKYCKKYKSKYHVSLI